MEAGGGLLYWADGPDEPPREHVGAMANTALIGDNHGMFHQVGPVAAPGQTTQLVTPSAELAPVDDGSGDWSVIDLGETVYRAPLDEIRVSVLWKADVYPTVDVRDERLAKSLSMYDVADRFNSDLAARGEAVRVDPDRFDDPELRSDLEAVYPEAVPVDAVESVFAALARRG